MKYTLLENKYEEKVTDTNNRAQETTRSNDSKNKNIVTTKYTLTF